LAILIGMDEAGYGPNLGPLVVAASVWSLPEDGAAADIARADLYELLTGAVRAESSPMDSRLHVADSKAVYKPKGPLAELERTVLSAISACGSTPDNWWMLQSVLGLNDGQASATPPPCGVAFADCELPLPHEVALSAIAGGAACLESAASATGVRLTGVHARPLFAGEFNAMLDELGKKSEILSRTTIALAGRCIEHSTARQPCQKVVVLCDKHGGRNHYAAMLLHQFPDTLVQVRRESREESSYRLMLDSTTVDFHFCARGETHLATALASMTAKYLRELAMIAFNRFWCIHVPGLRPTAGYPVDAKRFYEEIGPVKSALGIADNLVWRYK